MLKAWENVESCAERHHPTYADAYWNLDPLLVSHDFYGVEETTEGQSIPTESHPKQTTLKTEHPTTSTAKKIPVRKTRSDQTMKNKSSKLKSKINTKYQDSCSEPLNKKPEDEVRVEKQIEMFHSYSKVRKTPGRKTKQEASSAVETPAEARKRLAMTLLRIAGKYY